MQFFVVRSLLLKYASVLKYPEMCIVVDSFNYGFIILVVLNFVETERHVGLYNRRVWIEWQMVTP
jgi:hypothetical protein